MSQTAAFHCFDAQLDCNDAFLEHAVHCSLRYGHAVTEALVVALGFEGKVAYAEAHLCSARPENQLMMVV